MPTTPTGRVSLSRDQLLARLPERVGRDLSARFEGADFRVSRTWRGGNAQLYLVRLASGERLVLKVVVGPNQLDYEADILRRAAQLDPAEARLFPTLRAVLGETEALLLDYVPALPIRQALRRKLASPEELAPAVARALSVYHRRFGTASHDFHLSNVLVRKDGTVVMIDPARPGWAGLPVFDDPRISDLAFWTFSTARGIAWDVKASPRTAWHLLDLNARLVAGMLEPGEAATADRIERAALTLLPRMLRNWKRDRVLYVVGVAAVWTVMWRARRMLRANSGRLP